MQYGATRNYKSGAVTYLGPYISRGVLSTRQVYEHIQSRDLPWKAIEKLVQELAWRDYWQQVWMAKGNEIFSDLKNTQTPVSNHQIPKAIVHADTGIRAVDQAIEALYTTGYMHNHMRMYVASICCNMAQSHWLSPAKWLYAHLLDGDIASNHLSWQWVAGAFAHKKYYANQDNINRFFDSDQKGTFLDCSYEAFDDFQTPRCLQATVPFELSTQLPSSDNKSLQSGRTTLIYNYYNLDPAWHKGDDMQRVLLLEPSIFSQYPVAPQGINFMLELAENIPDIKIFVGEFEELAQQLATSAIIYKEHPLNAHYRGQEEPRAWISDVTGYYGSFFAFWKKCKKQLR